jgi:hypothetical protein
VSEEEVGELLAWALSSPWPHYVWFTCGVIGGMLLLVFGKWMGYLVLAVCFSGWLIIHSSLWFFGFWAQGPGTPTNQGPRGKEPSWVVMEGGLSASSQRRPWARRSSVEAARVARGVGYRTGLLSEATANGFGAPQVLPLTYIIGSNGVLAVVLRANRGALSAAQLREAIDAQLGSMCADKSPASAVTP